MIKRLLLCLAIGTLFTGCVIEDDDDMQQFTQTYTVRASDWKLSGDPDKFGSYYYYTFEEPKITPNVADYGKVAGYLYWKEGNINVQKPLPYINYFGEDTPAGGEALWQETYSFDFFDREITFMCHYSDFYTGAKKPPTCTFRVVLNWYP